MPNIAVSGPTRTRFNDTPQTWVDELIAFGIVLLLYFGALLWVGVPIAIIAVYFWT